MTTPDEFAAFQAFKAQLAAQQTADLPVTPAAPLPEPVAAVSIDLADVVGNGGYGPGLFTAEDKPVTSFTGTLAQPAFAKQDEDFKTKAPKFYDDGKPVPKVIVPLDVPVSDRHPDGRATWYARGKDIAELNRAATAAGVPRDVMKAGFEVGATITITYTEDRKNPQYPASNAAKIRTVTYTRPGQPVAPVAAVAAPAAPAVQVTPVTPAPASGLARPEGLTDEQFEVFKKALGQVA